MIREIQDEYVNDMLAKWVKELEDALKKPNLKKNVEKIVAKMDDFYFG